MVVPILYILFFLPPALRPFFSASCAHSWHSERHREALTRVACLAFFTPPAGKFPATNFQTMIHTPLNPYVTWTRRKPGTVV